MSAEFVQFNFPCKECLVRATCLEKTHLKDKVFKVNTSIACLAAPVFEELQNKNWQRHIFECISNLLRDWTQHTRKENIRGTHPDLLIPYEYFQVIITLCRIFQYMINSTSWRTGKLEKFDQQELSIKLKQMEWLLAHDKTRGWDKEER